MFFIRKLKREKVCAITFRSIKNLQIANWLLGKKRENKPETEVLTGLGSRMLQGNQHKENNKIYNNNYNNYYYYFQFLARENILRIYFFLYFYFFRQWEWQLCWM